MSSFLIYPALFAFIVYILYILLRPKHAPIHSESDENRQRLIALKEHANKYIVEFDNCEFRNSSYITEEEQQNTDYQLAGMLVGSSVGFFHTPVQRLETTQSVLFFRDETITDGKKFFQTFAMDMTTLKFHVLQGNVILWINKNDQDKYYFELCR
jgi:hypothetical protein